MTARTKDMPELLSFIEKRAGRDIALAFADKYGGARVYVPKTVRPDHPIEQIIGGPAAQALSEVYGGERVRVPLGPISTQARQAAAIEALIATGAADFDIARQLHVAHQTVSRARKRLEAAPQRLAEAG